MMGLEWTQYENGPRPPRAREAGRPHDMALSRAAPGARGARDVRSVRLGSSRARSARRARCRAVNDASTLLRDGVAAYERGARMDGYKLFEKALARDDLTLEERRELNYCAMCCVAAFGDVEAAKMYLREMEACGLRFDDAMADPGRMRMESSALMRNQLKKFAAGEARSVGAVRKEQFERERANAGGAPSPSTSSVSGLRDLDISSDTDESIEAIVKRVGILIALSIVGFAALFSAGMGIMQPGSLPFEEIY